MYVWYLVWRLPAVFWQWLAQEGRVAEPPAGTVQGTSSAACRRMLLADRNLQISDSVPGRTFPAEFRHNPLSDTQFRKVRFHTRTIDQNITLQCEPTRTTPWSRFLPEKLKRSKLLNKFPAFYRTWRFITVFTTARHLSLSWATTIQSMLPHSTSRRYILILSSHLRLGQVSPVNLCMNLTSPPYVPHVLPITVFLTWSPKLYLVRSTEHKAPLRANT